MRGRALHFAEPIFWPILLTPDDESQPGSEAVLPVSLGWLSISAPQGAVLLECPFPTHRESAQSLLRDVCVTKLANTRVQRLQLAGQRWLIL